MKEILQAWLATCPKQWPVMVSHLFLSAVVAFAAESRGFKDDASSVSGLSTNNTAGSTNTSYVLSANDLIKVEVYKEDDLRRETRIDQDGTVSLPLIKTISVGGRTIAEARELVRSLYEKDYLVAAHVTITLMESSQTNKVVLTKPKPKITVAGEVKKPGIVELPDDEKVDLVQAIALAGDFTVLANKRSVTVKRKENGVQRVYDINVQSMLRDAKAKPFEVLPGDVIEVRQTIF